MIQQVIPYSQLRPIELLKLYNEHAKQLNEPELRRPLPLPIMVQRLAIIRTRKPPKTETQIAESKNSKRAREHAPKREAPIRQAAIRHLCAVAYFLDSNSGKKLRPVNVTGPRSGLVSFGFSYAQIIQKMRREFPKSGVSIPYLHVECSNIRKRVEGYEGTLPMKRPRSNHRSPECKRPSKPRR